MHLIPSLQHGIHKVTQHPKKERASYGNQPFHY